MTKRKRPLMARGTAWLLALTLLLSCAHLASAEDAQPLTEAEYLAEAFELAFENGALALYTNTALGDIALMEKESGMIWWSNPPGAADDPIASGMPRQQLLSQMYVKYVDAKNNTYFAASRFSAVDQEGLTLRREGNSITYILDFKRDDFIIPVRYTLEADYLKVEVLLDEIVEYGENQVNQITLLPFFGAGGPDEAGYLFVPDGSGALINFNNGKQAAETFSVNIYGDEIVFGREQMNTARQQGNLPVFGIEKGGGTLLAVIHQGAAKAAVTANVGGKYSSYNATSSTYNHRMLGSVKLPTKNFQNRSVQVLGKTPDNETTYEVRYYPVSGGSGYVGMAARYREYLMAETGLSQADMQAGEPSLYLDLTGAVTLKKPVLGILSHVTTVLTPFEDAQALLTGLHAKGVDSMAVQYLGWNGGGLYGKLPARSGAEGKLGGNADLRALLDTAETLNAQIYLGADLINVYRTGAGFSRYRDAAQNVNRTVSLQYRYLPNTFLQDTETDPWMLLAPRLLEETHIAYAEQIRKATGGAQGVGAALTATGNTCYSDFSGKPSSRSQTAAQSVAGLAAIQDAGMPVLVNAAGAYAFAHADAITHVPDGASGFDVADAEVPFYQIALHGLVDMASLPINLCAQPRLRLLQCIALGMSPTFSLITSDPSLIKNTRADMLYSVEAAYWADYAAEAYKEVQAALAGTQGQAITGHITHMPGVTQTTYANGISVWVNATESQATIGGITVPAMGYTVSGETAKGESTP